MPYQSINMAYTSNDSDHTTSTTRDQDYETENEELKSKIRYLNSEIQLIQSLLENHKHCTKYRQNTSTMDSKTAKTQSVKCPA